MDMHMDIDYLLIILPGIVLLGIFGLILVIWQYGNFRSRKEQRMEQQSTILHPSEPELQTEEPEFYAQNDPIDVTTTTNPNQNRVPSLIILHLLAAEERPYAGYELVQTLSSNGFYYGAMNIFHYYQAQNEKNPRLFSLASAVEPGTFDLARIGEIIAPGLCLFMPTNQLKKDRASFELMLETANLLVQDLGGTLCDAQRQPLTADALTYYRSQLYSYV